MPKTNGRPLLAEQVLELEDRFSKQEIQTEAVRLFEKLRPLNRLMLDCQLIAPVTLEINRLKKQKNAVILAHNYQIPEIIFGVADFVGDSLGLSKQASQTTADQIVFCGVHFMAETAKIVNQTKKVVIPSLLAGCSLAESITAVDVRKLKAEHPGIPVVCYINTSAAVKAESDVCVTSANAQKIIDRLPGNEIIFIPDEFMAKNIGLHTNKKIVFWNGKCMVHEQFSPEMIATQRELNPDVQVLAHWECPPETIRSADFVGGTTDMVNHIQQSSATNFMMITECGMSDVLRNQFPKKRFVTPCTICPHMKQINLSNLLHSLQTGEFEITLDETVRQKAARCIQNMFELGK